MKILKIEDNKGYFYLSSDNDWKPIDQIDKDGLMELLNNYLASDVEMDAYDESLIQNQAHQIIYKSIFDKFSALNDNKTKFKDESERLYLDEIQKYKITVPASSENTSSELVDSSTEEELPRVRTI